MFDEGDDAEIETILLGLRWGGGKDVYALSDTNDGWILLRPARDEVDVIASAGVSESLDARIEKLDTSKKLSALIRLQETKALGKYRTRRKG